MQQHGGIFTGRVQHYRRAALCHDLTHDVDSLILKPLQMMGHAPTLGIKSVRKEECVPNTPNCVEDPATLLALCLERLLDGSIPSCIPPLF